MERVLQPVASRRTKNHVETLSMHKHVHVCMHACVCVGGCLWLWLCITPACIVLKTISYI